MRVVADNRLVTDTTRHATNTHLGDHGTMTAVFSLHQRRLVAMGRRMGCDRDRAHDAVQEAFIKAWRFADRYDPERPVGSWLSAITRSTVIDLHRKDERTVPVAALTEANAVPDAGAERERSLGMTRSAVRRAVTALPAVEREAVTLSHFEGLTHDEIAARLEVPLGTVKSRLFRAYRRLALLLTDEHDDAAA